MREKFAHIMILTDIKPNEQLPSLSTQSPDDYSDDTNVPSIYTLNDKRRATNSY